MATINLGAIKFNWKGAYNSGTTYAVDDVVSSGGNSYVCIQAHSNQAVGNATAYWNIMSSAGTNGTNGTDVGTTLTTQGDILYRDGSGLQRLAKGTAGKALVMNSGATAPEWGTVAGGKVLQVVTASTTTAKSVGTSTFLDTNLTAVITPSATSSKIFVITTQIGNVVSSAERIVQARILRIVSGTSDVVPLTIQSKNNGGGSASRSPINLSMSVLDVPNTTNAVTYKTQFNINDSAADAYLQQNSTVSTMTLMEIGA